MDDEFSEFANSLSTDELTEMYDAILEDFEIQDKINKEYYERKKGHGR